MSTLRLIFAGLRHHWRVHALVLIGVAVTSGVLVGALAVGDSVRHTLSSRAEARIGSIDAVLVGGDRFVRAALADALAAADAVDLAAPIALLPAVASTPRGDRRVLDARLLGVDGRFFQLAPAGAADSDLGVPAPREAHLGAALAQRLGVAAGDTVVLRVEQPSAVPRDLALSPDDSTAALRVKVARILTDGQFASFALDASTGPLANAFVDLGWMQQQLELDGTVNLIAARLAEGASIDAADEQLARSWRLEDASIGVETLSSGERELVSRRIFFDEPVVAAFDAFDAAPMTGTFTYFVERFGAGEAWIPYSMVTAIAPLGRAPARDDPLLSLSSGIERGGIRLLDWAADDLVANGWGEAPGAALELEYHVVDSSRQLVTRTHAFDYAGRSGPVTLAGREVPLLGTDAGRELMPDFPGLADADSCREWEPGTPVDLGAIRDVDEAFWDEHRGTPKAFVRLDDARELWSSRFGALTGVRFAAGDEDAVLVGLRAALDPRSLGLFLRDLGASARVASHSPTDFGGLFLGLSFFLIVAALLLTTQLFLFGVEAREGELGVLAATGFAPRRILGLLFVETGLVALVGAAIGVPLGLGYTRGVLRGLQSIWKDAVAQQTIEFHAGGVSVAVGASAALFVTLAAVVLGLRRALRRSPRSLLFSRQGLDAPLSPVRAGVTYGVAAALAVVAIGIGATVDPAGGPASSGAFFGAGAALLTAGLLVVRHWLRRDRGAGAPLSSIRALGTAGATRRAGRSLGTVALMGIGTFLVLSVGVNRLGPPSDVYARESGTGGFAYYGRTNLPLVVDLKSTEGLDQFALDAADLVDVDFVRMRTRDGDDASCLNLAASKTPRLLGVDPEAFSSRGAFSFAKSEGDVADPWSLLSTPTADGTVPAIGDVTSLTWQLKLGLGDTLDYVDERGQGFRVRIVAALADTVLQGDLVIAETAFERAFPSQGGYRRFLLDVPKERAETVRATLTESLADVGLELEPTGERLDAFHSVQNTYLSIFQLLGALGLVVGSIGLGLVVLRNTEERRGELALLSALGFSRSRVRRVVVTEYGGLLLAGLAVGVVASLLAVVPLLASSHDAGVLGRAAIIVAAVALNGLFWIVLSVALVSDRAPADGLRVD